LKNKKRFDGRKLVKAFFFCLKKYKMNKITVLQKINQLLPDLKREYHIVKIGVFGSVIREEAKKKSDIDIVYVMEEEYSLGFRAKIAVERKLKKTLGFKSIDFINSRCLNPIIALAIKDEIEYVG
jgi:uncharacterized protein